ncbi:tetratricopeptide repeat protein [Azospirillum picis]|uniref:Tetratricopeptide repeat protein n=1 Tax=Azospirillum picis TaxID=488438 RepID=A0ABU0MU28_9PROT|nr:tetratricopeptide repeat protein [Azospirillum picis]MBP2303062.1 hypothetical protein [Azospirillum picis]MDQ0536824.1 hypothetical protein [Azospirillum picis]
MPSPPDRLPDRPMDRRLAEIDAHYHAGRLDAAAAGCRAVLSEAPGHAGALHRLGVLHHLSRDDATAVRLLAAAAAAGHRAAHGDLGVALMKAGRPDEALVQFRTAHALAPQDPRAAYNLAMALLAAGAIKEGFRLYEARWRLKGPTPWVTHWDRFWDGRPLAGGTLLVHAEQGFGDSLQFARYVPLAAARGARVVLAVPGVLRRLMTGLAGCAQVLSEGERIPAYAAHAPLMSLPRLLGTTAGNIPATLPYLAAPATASPPSTGFSPDGRLQVGLVWAGRPEDPDDRHRSCPLAALSPLLALPGVRFHSLQVGAAEAALDRVAGGAAVVRHGGSVGDFADTAAVIAGLDLVIAVDTAIVHLAGALGRPAWVLLSADPDWRWMRGRADSPWYPTHRLFRQPQLGQWEPVVGRLRIELAALIGTRRPALAAPPCEG